MKIKTFRDVLALLLLISIVGLWVLDGKDIITLNEGVVGSTITIFALVAQFYFRKATAKEENDATT